MLIKTLSPLLITALYLLCGNVVRADAGLDTLKQKFEGALKQYDSEAAAETRKLELYYFGALDKLEKRFQENGELEPLIEVRKEKERYHTTKGISQEDLSSNSTVRELQSSFISQRDKIPVGKAQKIVNLKTQYGAALESYQKTLTRENKLEAALEVKNEKDNLSTIAQISEAEFILAEYGTENAEQQRIKEQSTAKAAQPKEKEPTKTVEKPKQQWSGKADSYIRRRFGDLIDELEDRNMENAIEFVDPKLRQEHGDNMARAGMNILGGIVTRIDREQSAKLSVSDVQLSEDESTATLTPKLYLNNQWHKLDAQQWVQREGDWYLNLGKNQGEGTADQVNRQMDHDDRADERRRIKRKRRR